MKPLAALLLLALLPCAQSQQSVNKELDACIAREHKLASATGSVLGFLSRFSVSRGGGGDGRGPSVGVGLAGAATGGAMGLASAWFTAMADCVADRPDWIPASQLERGAGYQHSVEATGYRAADGVVLKISAVEMPAETRPETRLQVKSRFVLLTPNGEEARVQIERRLYVSADGQEKALHLPAKAQESRTLAAGEHVDIVHLPIPKDAPLGVSYRLEISISALPKAEARADASVKVI